MSMEIDKRVAEEIFGLKVEGFKIALPWNDTRASYEYRLGYPTLPCEDTLLFHMPQCSTDIDAAMMVVDKMRERGFPWFLVRYDAARPENAPRWTAVFQGPDSFRGDADTPAMAICLAALAAVKK